MSTIITAIKVEMLTPSKHASEGRLNFAVQSHQGPDPNIEQLPDLHSYVCNIDNP